MKFARIGARRSVSFLILAIALAISSVGQGGPGVIVGNGTGLAEQNFAYVLRKLPLIYDLCLSKYSSCLDTNLEISLFKKIRENLDKELETPGLLEFESGSINPERFMIDHMMRVAVTGDKVGDTIFINTDLLYVREKADLHALDIGAAIAILTHEFGHHNGIRDHAFLDLVGAKVRAFVERESDRLRVDPFEGVYDWESVTNINLYGTHTHVLAYDHMQGAQSHIALSDGDDLHDLTKSIEDLIVCHRPDGTTARAIGYRLYNLRWMPRIDIASDRRIYPLRAAVLLHCGGDALRFDNDYEVTIELPFQLLPRRNTPTWVFNPANIKGLSITYTRKYPKP